MILWRAGLRISEALALAEIVGEEEEVVRAAVEHSASVHGHEDTPELRQQVRRFLEPARGIFERAACKGADAR